MHQYPRISCSIHATTYTQRLTQRADDSPSHPSSFPPTTSTCAPVLHPSDHHPHIPSHVSMTARTQGMAEGSSHPVNVAPWHSLIPTHLPATFQSPEEQLIGRLLHPTSLQQSTFIYIQTSHPNSYHLHISLHSNYLHQRVANRPSHPFDIAPQRSSPLRSR